jgi:hypothetical protein
LKPILAIGVQDNNIKEKPMAKKPSSKKAETKEIPGSPVKRTNRMYVSLKGIGECDEKGRSVFSLGYSGKTISEPDAPLSSMMVPLLREVMLMAQYSDLAAAKKDLATFKKWVKGISVKEQTQDDGSEIEVWKV